MESVDEKLSRHKTKIISLESERSRSQLKYALAIGAELEKVHSLLKGDRRFIKWAKEECGLDMTTTYDYLHLHQKFGDVPESTMNLFSCKAAVELSAPTVSDESRLEAIGLAERGQKIINGVALRLRGKHRRVFNKHNGNDPRFNGSGRRVWSSHSNAKLTFNIDKAFDGIREILETIRDNHPKEKLKSIAALLHDMVTRELDRKTAKAS